MTLTRSSPHWDHLAGLWMIDIYEPTGATEPCSEYRGGPEIVGRVMRYLRTEVAPDQSELTARAAAEALEIDHDPI